ncbi:MAG: hypothetical protein PVH73_05885 [Candidatus Bathyarchaeota archaeon]|jgi:hypothetical protein
MQNKKQVQVSPKMQKAVNNFYLFLVALYFLLASAQLINILVNLTVGSDVGTFFEFINASLDRIIVYALNFVTMLYITAKLRKILPVFLVFAYILASYFVFIQTVDMLIILISFVALVWFLTNPRPFSTMPRKKAISLLVVYLLLILVIIEVSALICWFIFPFTPKLGQMGACKYLVDLETKMFLLTASLAPVFTLLFLFSWITKPFFPRCNTLRRLRTLFTQSNNHPKNIYIKKVFSLLLLACPIILSFLIALYPFAPRLNVNMNPIGVDFPHYEEWLTKSANDNNFFSVITSFFFEHSNRPLSLFFIYLVKSASGLTASTVIQFSPLILSPALVSAVYFFMRETKTLSNASLLAAFLAVFSFHITVVMYGFLLSNWMALIELYLFMGFYFSSTRKRSYNKMVITLLLSISLLFTHSWTWEMSIGVLAAYLLLTIIHHRKNLTVTRFEIRFLIILILINVLVCIARNYVVGLPAGHFKTLQVTQNTVSVGALESFGYDLFYTLFHRMYGLFVNPMALLLAVLGSFIIVSDDTPVNRYLTAWLLGSCIFFVLSSGWVIKSRILANLPLPVLEAVGLVGITNLIKKFLDPDKTALINLLTISFILLVGLNYAFRFAFEMAQLA